MSVKRYEILPQDCAKLTQTPTGNWVRYLDYEEADKARTHIRNKLEETLKRERNHLEDLKVLKEEVGDHLDGWFRATEAHVQTLQKVNEIKKIVSPDNTYLNCHRIDLIRKILLT